MDMNPTIDKPDPDFWKSKKKPIFFLLDRREGPFSSPGARLARSLPGAVCFYTNINYFVIFCDFLRILFSRYIYSLLEGLIIITDCCMFVR